MVEVRANGFILDVKPGERIKYIKQVADLADLSTSNASTTMSFKLPKSPNNTQVFQSLGVVGDGSLIPYQRVVAQLLDDGLPIIKSGWLEVRNTNDAYNVNIKDGIIDFFKAIEGKKLGTDVDLSELNHVKTSQVVVDSFTNEFYTYLVNHYGGKTSLTDEAIMPFNIDYLVPSARIQYLWQRIFDTIGFTFSGQIFSNEDFVNAWMTFPKTNSELISNRVANFAVDELPTMFGNFIQDSIGLEYLNGLSIPFTESEILLPGYLQVAVEQNRLRSIFITNTNSYQFNITFDVTAIYKFRHNSIPFTRDVLAPLKLVVFKNGSQIQQILNSDEITIAISAQAGDIISFKIYALSQQEIDSWLASEGLTPINYNIMFFSPNSMSGVTWNNYSLEIFQVVNSDTDFNNTFKDFEIKAFVKEVMWRFALIAIPDELNNHVTFYTIDELLDESRGVIDWSDKYVQRTNESYILGSYAKNNWLRHKYNTEDAIYNDGNIPLNNANLSDETTLLTSKTYSPEELIYKLPYSLNQILNVFPTLIWQPEVKENNEGVLEISYKGLTGRYYWLKKSVSDIAAIFKSEQLGDEAIADNFNIASILDTTFSDLTPKYHQGHIRLLNDIRVHEIELSLSISDIVQIDFTRLYYFEQEASYYKLNKVTWEEGKNSTGEFIRVKRQTT